MKTFCSHKPARLGARTFVAVIGVGVLLASASRAEDKKNPVSKVYVSDVSGEAQIDTGENIQELNKRSVYRVQGTVIETKKAEREEDKTKVFSTMVYSNGTGAYFEQDTRVEVKKFVQEPFTPNRTDMEVEPSISQTQAFVARGTVGLCTSKLVAGSSMNYQTPHGAINIRGRKVVIQTSDNETKISMLEGDSTVRGGSQDLGGQTLHAGEQAIIRNGTGGAPSQVQIMRIPPAEVPQLDDKVAQACMAKKTVYFEVRERQSVAVNEPGTASTTQPDTTSGTANDPTGTAPSGPITAFDGNSITSPGVATSPGVIVAVPVVPTELPVKFTVSPAQIITPSRPGG